MSEPGKINQGGVKTTRSQNERVKTLRQIHNQHKRLEEATWEAYRDSTSTREQEDASDRRNYMLATSEIYRQNARNYLKSIGQDGNLDYPIPQSAYMGDERVVMNGPYVAYTKRDSEIKGHYIEKRKRRNNRR